MFVFKRPSKKSSLKIFSLQIKLANFQLDTKELSIKDKSIFLFEKKCRKIKFYRFIVSKIEIQYRKIECNRWFLKFALSKINF